MQQATTQRRQQFSKQLCSQQQRYQRQ